ncbi:response regulator with CheY-like receiver domain and winged-helix DNA-binding domain [Mycobacteroides abscessus subsp. abscessus]|nr:response regulator with CheY-like receiver domain and winged-helix DNA-binding domain [Mycobacteroides abscessus subsp. abscessus]
MDGNILIVDDDKEIRHLISVYLENEGLKTSQAENALEALGKLEEQAFDLIILDIMMPEMDGISSCSRRNRKIWTRSRD